MKFISTRGQSKSLTLSECLSTGLASDGGLFVPEVFPTIKLEKLSNNLTLPDFAYEVLKPFFDGDELAPYLKEICSKTFDFPIPLKYLKDETALLELFHGPTAAFKDVGARFLAHCLEKQNAQKKKKQTVLVATSGDTGGAVAAAFYQKEYSQVIVLFPENGVSERQKKQLTCWGENIFSFAVRGTFDDCQRMVKEAMSSDSLRAEWNFTSANSINIGRLLPQMVYSAAASFWYYQKTKKSVGIIIPSGNLGNSCGSLWAMKMGFPVREIALATNANRTLSDYFSSGEWKPRSSISTLANAMDVGSPSNIERVWHLLGHDLSELKKIIQVVKVEDETIKDVIQSGESSWGEILCPHTATGIQARTELKGNDWIVMATAHPAKFETIVEPLIGKVIEVPQALKELLGLESLFTIINPDLNELMKEARKKV